MSEDEEYKVKYWKSKHRDALRELDAHEASWKTLEQILRRLVTRLSTAAMGADSRLDAELNRISTANRRSAAAPELELLHDALAKAIAELPDTPRPTVSVSSSRPSGSGTSTITLAAARAVAPATAPVAAPAPAAAPEVALRPRPAGRPPSRQSVRCSRASTRRMHRMRWRRPCSPTCSRPNAISRLHASSNGPRTSCASAATV